MWAPFIIASVVVVCAAAACVVVFCDALEYDTETCD